MSTSEELRAVVRGVRVLVGSARWMLLAFAVQHVVSGAAGPATAWAVGTLVDAIPRADVSPEAARSVVVAVLVIGGLLVTRELIGGYANVVLYVVLERFAASLRRQLMTSLGSLPGLRHFEDPREADRLQRAESATSDPYSLVSSFGNVLSPAVTIAGAAALIARLGWWAPAVAIAATLPGAVQGWRHAGRQAQARSAGVTDLRFSAYHHSLGTGLELAKEVRIFGFQSWLLERHDHFWNRGVHLLTVEVRSEIAEAFRLWGVTLLPLSLPTVVAIWGASSGRLELGDLATVLIALTALAGALTTLQYAPRGLRQAARFLPDLFGIIDLAEPAERASAPQSPPARPASGIRLQDVRFTYPGAERPVLTGLDLEIRAGECLALVGENGSGKSTIVKLLCRFYEPDAGSITLDGIDMRDLDLAEMRSRFAVIFQDFVRYPMPVEVNVGVGCVERMGDAELLQAAAGRAGLAEIVERLPHGWQTQLQRDLGGVDLSGGEWQRVALARALTSQLGRDAAILILDEPTAALDVRAEAELYRRFAELTRGRTTLLISHRLSTVRMADRIAVLEGGRIIEQGRHADLLAEGGRYAELFELQAKRFRETGEVE